MNRIQKLRNLLSASEINYLVDETGISLVPKKKWKGLVYLSLLMFLLSAIMIFFTLGSLKVFFIISAIVSILWHITMKGLNHQFNEQKLIINRNSLIYTRLNDSKTIELEEIKHIRSEYESREGTQFDLAHLYVVKFDSTEELILSISNTNTVNLKGDGREIAHLLTDQIREYLLDHNT